MDQNQISFGLVNPGQGLTVTVILDGQTVYQSLEACETLVTIPFPDDEGDHKLQIILSGKQGHHTTIAADGTIEKDLMVAISNICMNEIDIDYMVHFLAIYEHDFNGTQPLHTDKFYGNLGCNGTVTFAFTTPAYLWLLENM